MKEKGITGSRRPESSPKMLPLQVANSQQRRGQFLGGENGSINRRDNCILNNIIGLHLSMGIASNIGDNMKLKTIAFIIASAGMPQHKRLRSSQILRGWRHSFMIQKKPN